MRKVLAFMGVLQPKSGRSAAGGSSAPPTSVTFPIDHDTMAVLAPQQVAELAAFITGQAAPRTSRAGASSSNSSSEEQGGSSATTSSSASSAASGSNGSQGPLHGLLRALGLGGSDGSSGLKWPEPPFRLTAKQRLAINTHARLYGYGSWGTAGSSSNGSSDGSSAPSSSQQPLVAPAMAQRPQLKGPHAGKVGHMRTCASECGCLFVCVRAPYVPALTLTRMCVHTCM